MSPFNFFYSNYYFILLLQILVKQIVSRETIQMLFISFYSLKGPNLIAAFHFP